jgi:hypothetical protein
MAEALRLSCSSLVARGGVEPPTYRFQFSAR